ncbi:MaoC family dehydratase [Solihabitans fulvus]|uniref:MaoC family dehydratase n=1 Tax=Solihabitans fulvus TaxID=1892852 RepID=A0A5B2XG10_9PSEU|nr:MaoC family dehydratase [Solihabitans fulvus]KAA2261722.1 MaoC family dehydratase [Solihabitans fulvus]
MRVFSDLAQLALAKGEHLGHGEWTTVDQQQVDLFAEATGDHQWIHVDTARAAAGPFGGTIAHGYLTLSLIPKLTGDIYTVEKLTMGVNYGTNKVRFPSPLLVGSRVRAGLELIEVTEVAQGVQAVIRCTVEIEGKDKPACVAETVVLFVP